MKFALFQKSGFTSRQKIICILITLIVSTTFAVSKITNGLEYFLHSLWFNQRNKSREFANEVYSKNINEIILILIDDDSLKEENLAWPIPRSLYPKYIKKINDYHPKVIALDITFEQISQNPDFDKEFADFLKLPENDNVILAYRLASENGHIKNIFPHQTIIPHWTAEKKLKNIGYVDTGDQPEGVVRQTDILHSKNGIIYYSFDALILAKYKKIPLSEIKVSADEKHHIIGDYQIPVSGNCMWINYVGKKSEESLSPFTAIRIITLTNLLNENPDSLNYLINGKIVILGVSAVQGFDNQQTPLGPAPGSEIHVNILLNIMKDMYLREASNFNQYLLTIVPSLILAFLLFYLSPASGFIVLLLSLLGIYQFSSWSFIHEGVISLYATSMFTLCLTYASITIIQNSISQKAQRRIKKLLLELAPVPEPILDTIMQRYKGKIALGGEKIELTILFSDIRGYTALSQNLDPQDIMALLNDYYSAMARVYKENGGMNFDIMGDGQMIVFGAEEKTKDNHAYLSVKSALEMRQELYKLNEHWKSKNQNPIDVGIGINTGVVSLGFLGSDQHGQRKQFSAIGDATNVASRIETLTKTLKAPIIISETTYEQAKDRIVTEDLPPTHVKGKDEPLKIYKVIGLKDNPGENNA